MSVSDPLQLQSLYSWYKYSLSKAPRHLIKSKDQRKWEIQHIEPMGRSTVAKRDIKEGEIIFVDHPIITGPRQDCGSMCLGCYKQMDSWDSYKCSKCGWPVCGPDCESKGYHPTECKYLSQSDKKLSIKDFMDGFMYEAILPLRVFCLKETDPDRWKTVMALQSHNEERRGTELWEREEVNVVKFLRQTMKVSLEEELLHTITGILDVNCHEVQSNLIGTEDRLRVRALYPLCVMMSHVCCNNTYHTFTDDLAMVVLASRPIKKGELITASYTHLLSATIERRKHLQYGKFFDCVCDRCKDPTELGTYFGALKCSQTGCEGYILCTDPLCVTNDAPWECQFCHYAVPAETVELLNKMVYHELRQLPPQYPPSEFENIFKKFKAVFHPQHFHMVGLKYHLSQCYGKVHGFSLNELNETQLARKTECCQDLLKVLDVIDPGISRLRGMTMYELHAPILLKCNKAFMSKSITRKNFLKGLKEAEELLSKAIYCLQFEQKDTNEGQIHQTSKTSLQELRAWINKVQGLPNQYFLPDA